MKLRDIVAQKLEESMDWLRKTVVMPSNSTLHPKNPMKNEYHSTWRRWDEPKNQTGTYLLLRKYKESWNADKPDKHIILSGSGSKENYPNPGEQLELHHQQTGRHIGSFRVIAKEHHTDVHNLPVKYAPLYVYK